MTIYNIYLKKTTADKIEDIICIKDGFSWPAFLFGPLWFAYHKMFKEFLILIIINILINNFQSSNLLGNLDILLLQFGFSILIANNANFWRIQSLAHQNYQFSASIVSDSSQEALAKFIKHFLSSINFDLTKFDEAIISPKAYHNSLKHKKNQPYFVI
jgi:hypothetical protein